VSVIPARYRNRGGRGGRHAADPLNEPTASSAPPEQPTASSAPPEKITPAPAASSAAAGMAVPAGAPVYEPGPGTVVNFTGTSATLVQPQPQPQAQPRPQPPFAADYARLPLFRAAIRKACTDGRRALGVRAAYLAPPPPDYKIAELCAAWSPLEFTDDDYDQMTEEARPHAEAGFHEADRVFHSEHSLKMRAAGDAP
jgi:hypothetical protein